MVFVVLSTLPDDNLGVYQEVLAMAVSQCAHSTCRSSGEADNRLAAALASEEPIMIPN